MFYGYVCGGSDYDSMGIGYEPHDNPTGSSSPMMPVSRFNFSVESFSVSPRTPVALLEYSMLGVSSFNIYKDEDEYLGESKERRMNLAKLDFKGL